MNLKMRRLIRKVCNALVLACLLVALAALSFILACKGEDEDEKVLYGPPPDGMSADTEVQDDLMVLYGPVPLDQVGDGAAPDVQEDSAPPLDSVLYGPLDVVEELPPVYYGPVDVQADQPQVLYGPIDVAEAAPVYGVQDVQLDQARTYYGPMPVDVVQDAVEDTAPQEIATKYGPQPAQDVAAQDCSGMAWYGPPPCQTDEECVKQNGPGWYCDLDNKFDNGCGGTTEWPVCKKK